MPDDMDEMLDQVIAEGGGPGRLHDRLVQDELRALRARAEARRLFAEEQQGPPEPFDAGTLADVLARPAQPVSRVEGLIPWQASTLVAAQRKTGKTTAVLNLARSLLTGEDFLGRFGVRPVSGEVALLNFEVSAGQLAGWAAEVGVDADRLFLVNLRGRRSPLGSEEDRGRLAGLLRSRGVETIICDPFGRAYTGNSQNDAGEVGAFLAGLDLFARTEVGALDLVLTAHAGWNGERTRGSTALEDWADSIITLTRDDTENGQGTRYLRAIGRDVDLDEDRLEFDPDTRALTLAGTGSRAAGRAERRHEDLDRAVLSVIIAQAGVNGSGIGRALREAGVGFQKGDERQSAGRLVAAGRVEIKTGPRGANCYHPVTYPDVPRPLLYRRGTSTGHVRPRRTPVARSSRGEPMTPAEQLTRALVDLATRGRRPRCGDPVTRDLWTSEDREERQLAASWCTGCPALVECHAAAEATPEVFGVWAGVDRSPQKGRRTPTTQEKQ